MEDKAKSKSVSLTPELWEKVEAKVTSIYGTRSAYFKTLVERDLNDDDPAKSSITSLAREYRKGLEPIFTKHHLQNETLVIDKLLTALASALERGDFKADGNYHLYNYSLIELIAASRSVVTSLIAASNGGNVEAAKKIVSRTYTQPEEEALKVAETTMTDMIIDLSTRHPTKANPPTHKPAPTPPPQKPTARE